MLSSAFIILYNSIYGNEKIDIRIRLKIKINLTKY